MDVRAVVFGTGTVDTRVFRALLASAIAFPPLVTYLIQTNALAGDLVFWTFVGIGVLLISSPLYLGYRGAGLARGGSVPLTIVVGINVASVLAGNWVWVPWMVFVSVGIGCAGYLIGVGVRRAQTELTDRVAAKSTV